MVPESPLLPLGSVVEFLRAGIPDVQWLIGEIEKQQGWFRFPPYLSSVITNLKLENYPLLYRNEASIVAVFFLSFMSMDEVKARSAEFESASLDERAAILRDWAKRADDLIESFEIPKTPKDQEAANRKFLALSPEEQAEETKVAQHFFLSFFPSFHQWLSVMVHGEKLTSLVAQAEAGDDEAFVKAVQIDQRILTELPYFKARFARARDEADADFSDKIGYRLRNPPYRGKIRHRSLWVGLAMVEGLGWLENLSYKELLEVFDEVGVGGFDNRIQSEKHLANRVREYRTFQKRGIVTTP